MVQVERAQEAVSCLLEAFQVDEGEYEEATAGRVAAAWQEALSGYADDPAAYLRKHFLVATDDPGLVVVAGISFRSTCAHHLLPIVGKASVGYRPSAGQGVVGLSKLVRTVTAYSRRLQLQERLGLQIAGVVQDELKAVGAGCVITANHACMTWRGVSDHGAVTTTRSLAGEWTDASNDVAELLSEHRAAMTARNV